MLFDMSYCTAGPNTLSFHPSPRAYTVRFRDLERGDNSRAQTFQRQKIFKKPGQA